MNFNGNFSTNTNTLLNNQQHPFHIVKPSPWPFLVSVSLYIILVITVLWMHNYAIYNNFFTVFLPLGCWSFLFSIISWFWDIIIEATFEGHHTFAVQKGLRIGFILFIVSEIIFFFSFFWAFFHSSVSPSIWIGAVWPPLGIQTINPWGLPLLNTAILLSSGVTVTWAHKAITAGFIAPASGVVGYNARSQVFFGLALTIILGLIFTGVQLFEYIHSGFSINDVITGFHGFHVLVGTIFLIVCFFRHVSYHFTRDHHLGFEIAIWYWHFVDVVWIFLYIFVYIWGI
jgi:heme/copper-type cytochrome/quinol oxidase subunit 3